MHRFSASGGRCYSPSSQLSQTRVGWSQPSQQDVVTRLRMRASSNSAPTQTSRTQEGMSDNVLELGSARYLPIPIVLMASKSAG